MIKRVEETDVDLTESEVEMLIDEISKKLKLGKEYNPLSEQNFEPLVGKRFKMIYKSKLREVIEETPLRCAKINYIEGYLENFSPHTGVILYDKEYGFNIIPLKSIVQMEQIVDEE
jgi:hypothetical protein